ncbi:hypothetical protein D3C85_920470 [compost metagenome]
MPQRFEVACVVDRASAHRLHRDTQRVRLPLELVLLLEVVNDIGMLGGHHPLEARVQRGTEGQPTEDQRRQRTQPHHDAPMVEEHPLQTRT